METPFNQHLRFKHQFLPVGIMNHDFNKAGEFFMPHWHEELEILYVISGQATFQVENETYITKAGSMVIIKGDEIHSTYASRSGDNRFIKFFCNIDNPLFYYIPEFRTFMNTVSFPNPIDAQTSPGKEILAEILSIQQETNDPKAAEDVFIAAHLYTLLGILMRYYGNRTCVQMDSLRRAKMREMINGLFEYVERNYMNDISLEQVARHVNLSVSHFCKIFKDMMNMSFMEYLSLYRVNRSEFLLRSTVSVFEISIQCGFASVAAYTRAFKKYRKTTPSSYRKSM